jgi:hypothetical protein
MKPCACSDHDMRRVQKRVLEAAAAAALGIEVKASLQVPASATNDTRALSRVWMATAAVEKGADEEEEEEEELSGGTVARIRAGKVGAGNGQPEKLREGGGEGNIADAGEGRRKRGVMMRGLSGAQAGMSSCQCAASCETYGEEPKTTREWPVGGGEEERLRLLFLMEDTVRRSCRSSSTCGSKCTQIYNRYSDTARHLERRRGGRKGEPVGRTGTDSK